MLFNKKPEIESTPVKQESGMEFFGDPILPEGAVQLDALPDSLRDVISRIDVSALPVADDAKEFLKSVQDKAVAAVNSNIIDTKTVPVQKITSISQLTAEQRKALSSMVASGLEQVNKNKEPELSGVRTFNSSEEMFSHVTEKMANLNAVQREAKEAEDIEPEKTRPLFSQGRTQKVETEQKTTIDSAQRKAAVEAARSTLTHCPHCKLNLFAPVDETTEEQRRNFMVAALHGRPYTEQFELFGGMLSVRFSALTSFQNDCLISAVTAVNKRKDVSDHDQYEFFVRASSVFTIEAIQIEDELFQFPVIQTNEDATTLVETIILRFTEIADKIPDNAILRTVCEGVLSFLSRCRTLSALGLNSDFWRPTR